MCRTLEKLRQEILSLKNFLSFNIPELVDKQGIGDGTELKWGNMLPRFIQASLCKIQGLFKDRLSSAHQQKSREKVGK